MTIQTLPKLAIGTYESWIRALSVNANECMATEQVLQAAKTGRWEVKTAVFF